MNESPSNTPCTIVISNRVKKGHEQEYEKLATEITESATGFKGHLGAFLFRPISHYDPEYRVIFKFDKKENLDAWLNSDERRQRLPKIDKLLDAPSQFETVSSLVTWFSLPDGRTVAPPPRYKMAIVTWLAIFPLITLIFVMFGDLLARAPLVPRIFIVTAFVIALMTYIIMPQYTKWFRRWLYPEDRHDRR